MARRKTVAYLTNSPGFGDDYQGVIRLGIEQACKQHEIDLWVYTGRTNWSADPTQITVYELLDAARIDGIVLSAGVIASHYSVAKVLEGIRATCSAPTVAIGHQCAGVCSIVVDNARGSAHLAEHLAHVHGYRKFVYIGGPENHDDSRHRLEGTISALSRHGITLSPEAVRYANFSKVVAREATRDLLRKQYGFDVIIAASDDMATGALEVLQAEDIHCPVQVAVVGFDDSPSARLCQPALTTVRQPLFTLGETAIEQLVQMWNGHEPPSVIMLDTKLVVRESCGCTPLTASTASARPSTIDAAEGAIDEITQSLGGLVDNVNERRRWADKLRHALRQEQVGIAGSLGRALDSFVDALPGAHLPIYELQGMVSALLGATSGHSESSAVEGSLRGAGTLVTMHAYRRPAQRQLDSDFLLAELCGSWDVLSTALSLSELTAAIGAVLPRIGIRDAFIAYHPRGNTAELVPLVCLHNASVVALPSAPYRARLLLPDGVFTDSVRRSLTVFPLTFRTERLGVAALCCPLSLEIYSLLREQLSSALKVIQLHEDMLSHAAT